MFGSDDNNQQKPTEDKSGTLPVAMPDPINGPISPSASAVNSVFGSTSGAPEVPANTDNSSSRSFLSSPAPSTPIPETTEPPSISVPSTDASSTTTNDNNDKSSDDLIGLKQQALQQLSPLVSHLEQTPEEKFRTTMMMIQASDDQTLIKSAFEVAQKITDDKARAQALLDVINEINYFTQHTATS